MEIKKIIYKILTPFVVGIVAMFLTFTNAYAASGSISIVPITGTYQVGQVFSATIRIDGGGQSFNAVKANVAVSQNLKVQSLNLGDCGMALVKTPSIGSLSFAGVILGGSQDSCNIYTLNLQAESSGTGFVFISDGSIKAYKGAVELLSKLNNSSYTFNGASSGNASGNSVASAPTPTQPPLSLANGIKLYTLVYNIATIDNKPPTTLKVALDSGLPSQMISPPQASSENPSLYSAIFDNVPQGVHSITVLDNEKPVSKEIVNIQGQNREVTLGVNPKSSGSSSFIWLIALAIVTIIILTVSVLFYTVIWRKNHPGNY